MVGGELVPLTQGETQSEYIFSQFHLKGFLSVFKIDHSGLVEAFLFVSYPSYQSLGIRKEHSATKS